MIMNFRRFRGMGIAVLTAATVAACQSTPSPQAVQSSNPRVTYNYRTDQELIQANQNAATFCSQYQTSPRTASLTNNADGSKTVVFECVRTGAALPAPASVNPNLTHTYRTDQELVQATHTASTYCQRVGSQPMTSSIVTNTNGSKTVTFQCGPR